MTEHPLPWLEGNGRPEPRSPVVVAGELSAHIQAQTAGFRAALEDLGQVLHAFALAFSDSLTQALLPRTKPAPGARRRSPAAGIGRRPRPDVGQRHRARVVRSMSGLPQGALCATLDLPTEQLRRRITMPTKVRRPQAPKPRYSAEHLQFVQDLRRGNAARPHRTRAPRPTERRRALLEQEG